MLHLWRWIGHIMGIQDQYLTAFTSWRSAVTLLQSVATHIVLPDQTSTELARHVIGAVAMRSPTFRTHRELVAITRAFTGDAYADALGIPQASDPLLEVLERGGDR